MTRTIDAIKRGAAAVAAFFRSGDINDLFVLAGVGLVVAGVAMWSVPTALIFTGFYLVAVGYLGAKAAKE
jgi:uncharacterized protein (DUF983 family)